MGVSVTMDAATGAAAFVESLISLQVLKRILSLLVFVKIIFFSSGHFFEKANDLTVFKRKRESKYFFHDFTYIRTKSPEQMWK